MFKIPLPRGGLIFPLSFPQALSTEFRVHWRGGCPRPARTGLRWSPGPMNSFFTTIPAPLLFWYPVLANEKCHFQDKAVKSPCLSVSVNDVRAIDEVMLHMLYLQEGSTWLGFPSGSMVASPPGLGISLGEGKGNLLQYSWLEKYHVPSQSTVHGVTKSQIWLSNWAQNIIIKTRVLSVWVMA